MTSSPSRQTQRHFIAHCSTEGEHPAPYVTAASSFEEAALLFVERWHGPHDELRVMVFDRESGEQACFTIDLGGHVSPCD